MPKVHIEFQRVQTWLFAVPRLRAMVGANTLLGELLRIKLPKLAQDAGLLGAVGVAPPATKEFTGRSPTDPLPTMDHEVWVQDDPRADYLQGIVARDGGHFEVLVESWEKAEQFGKAASRLIQIEAPGLSFRLSIDGQAQPIAAARVIDELPILAPCEWTGRGLASTVVHQGDDRAAVSIDVQRRHEAAKRAAHGQALDVASLLVGQSQLSQFQRAQDLNQLAGQGYLALIHADGNSLGQGAKACVTDGQRASFFHRNRVLMRQACLHAINVSCAGRQGVEPMLPLMLGGDDLLVVARADRAMGFVLALCHSLSQLQSQASPTGEFTLTLGIGVVIAKPNIPFHRLHAVAEELASSAKRKAKAQSNNFPAASVVDWAVYSSSWVADPMQARRRDWIRGQASNRRFLSCRPLPVLGDDADLGSLQGLVTAAQSLQNAPRSQLRYLVEQLDKGKVLSELAFTECSPEARSALKSAGISAPWFKSPNAWMSHLLDLVEVLEIGRLGSAQAQASSPEVAV